MRQSKSVRARARRPVYVTIPVGAPLKTALDAAIKIKKSPIILLNSDGNPWTPDGFRASWGKACKRREVDGGHVQRSARHRRHAAWLGRLLRSRDRHHHRPRLRDVRSILDAHYLHRDPALAESAIRKLEMGYAQGLIEAKTGTESTK